MTKHETLAWFALSATLVASAACGSESDHGGDDGDDPMPCQAASCGKESFRRAIPGRNTVRIDFQRASARELAPGQEPVRRLGARPPGMAHLEEVAPGYQALGEHVDEINEVIDDLFGELDEMSTGAPEIEEDTVHQWRSADSGGSDVEYVLRLESADETAFELTYAAGPAGFEPTDDDTFMTGSMMVEDGDKGDFDLTLDFDVESELFPDEVALTGELNIRSEAEPEGGEREIWYDYTAFGEVGGDLEDSITTYWVFGDEGGALEYLDSLHDSDATVYARWDEGGGRIDHDVAWYDDVNGNLEEISTDCWAGAGAETFWASAIIDESGNYFVELDGDEADCAFGPLADHPDPGEEFANLPGEGEWDDLESSSLPYCEDEPEAPDCVYYCDIFPEDC